MSGRLNIKHLLNITKVEFFLFGGKKFLVVTIIGVMRA
jgi:hypothetical protein